jgi:hypothetical protein
LRTLEEWTLPFWPIPPTENAREAAQVSETRATKPVFPPGRYGHRREPGARRRVVPIGFLILVLAASVLLTVRLYDRWGQTDYTSRIVGWSDVTDAKMTIEFAVRIPQGGTAACVVRARSYDGAEVGRLSVTVDNPAPAAEIKATAEVPTTARASHGDVVRCRAAD